METRYSKEVRAAADGKFSISGYAAKYNTVADVGDFDETILPGAFDGAVRSGQDVKCLFNHDESIVLGRVANGTLKLRADDKGLWFECQLNPESAEHKNVYASIQRGDVSECSFGFSAQGNNSQRFSMQKNGKPLREIMQVEKLFDVSPVTYPAYQQGTSVAARSFMDAEARSAFDSAMLSSITKMVAHDKAYDAMVDAYLKNRALEAGAAIAASDTDAANMEQCAAIAQRIADEGDDVDDEREEDEYELTGEDRSRIARLFAQELFQD